MQKLKFNKLNILMICEGLVPGGKERQLIEVIKNLDKKEFKVGLITFNKDHHYSQQARENTDYFRELKKRPTRLEPLFTIWKCFTEFKPDIVHTWDSLSSFYCYLPCKLLNIPIIDGSIRDAGTDKGFFYHFKRFFLKRSNLIISNSIAGLNQYRVKGSVLYNAIDLSRFLSTFDRSEYNIIMTANFTDYKDHGTFFNAAVELVNNGIVHNVFLLGDGPNKEKYINTLKQDYPEKFQHFHFPGAVKNVEYYLTKCSIGVLCSTPEFSEGLSNSVLEYMAAGLVPIVTNLGGSNEIVEDNINGFLIKPKDHERIIEIVTQLKNEPEKIAKITERAKSTIEQKFSMKHNLNLLVEFYKQNINS